MPGFSAIAGAVTDERGVVLHYGQLFAEQRALAAGGVVARDDLAVLALDGGDRLSWLDSLSSQAVGALAPGESAETLVLDPHGHIEQVLHVVDDGSTSWLIVSAERAGAAFDWLDRMRFRKEVRIRRAEELRVLGQLGTQTLSLDSTVSWTDPWPGVAEGGFGYAAQAEAWSYREWLVPETETEQLIAQLQQAGVSIAGLLAWQALRIAAGRPDASDLDEKSLPHEFDWLRTAVHLNKGCYRGQETVAKLHNLGRPPRRLVLLHLDGSDSVLPAAGDEVWAERDGEPRQVGQVTAAANHYELGPIALALIKRAVPAAQPLLVHCDGLSIAASQHELVPADAGPALNIPRFPRLGVHR